MPGLFGERNFLCATHKLYLYQALPGTWAVGSRIGFERAKKRGELLMPGGWSVIDGRLDDDGRPSWVHVPSLCCKGASDALGELGRQLSGEAPADETAASVAVSCRWDNLCGLYTRVAGGGTPPVYIREDSAASFQRRQSVVAAGGVGSDDDHDHVHDDSSAHSHRRLEQRDGVWMIVGGGEVT